ncbi:hypothetical protein AO056_04366 [Aeromonas hydrophila]|nr:hypothetical protein AO056_04366 [Aeromonas hydrophila]
MVETAQFGPHHHDDRHVLLLDPVRQQMFAIERQKPAPRPLHHHQLGPRLFNLAQPVRQPLQGNGIARFAGGDMGRDGRLVSIGVDQIVGQRQARRLLQQHGIKIAQPVRGAGTAGGDGFVTGAAQTVRGELQQQGAGDQRLAHIGIGAGDEEGFNHDDSSIRGSCPGSRWRAAASQFSRPMRPVSGGSAGRGTPDNWRPAGRPVGDGLHRPGSGAADAGGCQGRYDARH